VADKPNEQGATRKRGIAAGRNAPHLHSYCTGSLKAVPMLDLSAKAKTTKSAKMNTGNHLLQWYEVQDNKCSE
jgi:hypothetical protein